MLRGEYGRYRANNDLLHYDLDVRVDPEKKWISGKNTVEADNVLVGDPPLPGDVRTGPPGP